MTTRLNYTMHSRELSIIRPKLSSIYGTLRFRVDKMLITGLDWNVNKIYC